VGMLKTGLLAAAGMVAGSSAVAQDGGALNCDGGDRNSCRYILAAEAELTNMLVTADPAPLRRHLDPRALWITTRGEVRSGAEFVDFISRDTRRATAKLERAHVRFFGDVATVTWEESWTAPGTSIPAGRLAGVDTWARQRGRWRLITMTETRLAP
jgi:hypothetical protein